jgi:hypothetical protein
MAPVSIEQEETKLTFIGTKLVLLLVLHDVQFSIDVKGK